MGGSTEGGSAEGANVVGGGAEGGSRDSEFCVSWKTATGREGDCGCEGGMGEGDWRVVVASGETDRLKAGE